MEDPNLFGESRSKLDLEKKQQTYKIPYYVLHGKEWNTFAFKHENNNSKNKNHFSHVIVISKSDIQISQSNQKNEVQKLRLQ